MNKEKKRKEEKEEKEKKRKKRKKRREDKEKKEKKRKEKYNNIIYVGSKLYYYSHHYYRIRNTLPKVLRKTVFHLWSTRRK